MSLFVETLWYHEGGGGACERERYLTDGRRELLINLRDEPLAIRPDVASPVDTMVSDVALAGCHIDPFEMRTGADLAWMGALLRVGAPGGPVGVAPEAAHGSFVHGEEFWGADTQRLYERVRSAGTPRHRLEVLEAFLAERLRAGGDDGSPHPAVRLAVDELWRRPNPRPVAAICDDLGLSGRYFAKIFREQVGMTPKRFARVQRFQHALGLLERTSRPDWAQIALDGGYYDQSHFIHDFKAFSGYGPSQYLALRRKHREHVHEGIHFAYSVCHAGHHRRTSSSP